MTDRSWSDVISSHIIIGEKEHKINTLIDNMVYKHNHTNSPREFNEYLNTTVKDKLKEIFGDE